MIALTLSLIWAFILIPALGGRYSHLSHDRYHVEWLIPLWIIVQTVGPKFISNLFELTSSDAAIISWLLGSGMLLGACFANSHRVGFMMVGFGVSLNLIVILANRGMPVSPAALETLGLTLETERLAALTPLYHLQTSMTKLPVLADVLPIPGPPLIRSVASIGDLILMVGVALVILESSECLFRPVTGIPAGSLATRRLRW